MKHPGTGEWSTQERSVRAFRAHNTSYTGAVPKEARRLEAFGISVLLAETNPLGAHSSVTPQLIPNAHAVFFGLIENPGKKDHQDRTHRRGHAVASEHHGSHHDGKEE